jgi:hypothetical protein
MNTSQADTANITDDAHYRLRGLPLAGVVTALFLALLMAALDGSIVDTATPRIIGDLHGFSLYSWLVTIYLLTSTTIRAATKTQVLTSAAYRQSITQQGISATIHTTSIPAGAQHASLIASLTQQTAWLLNQLFEVVRQALATSIHQAFIVSFCLCLAIVVTTLFLKDSPRTQGKVAKEEEPLLSCNGSSYARVDPPTLKEVNKRGQCIEP